MKHNIALIDGQNLHLGTTRSDNPWSVDFTKFRIYLRDKYNVTEAYYFLGYRDEKHQKLYSNLEAAGFTIIFKPHHENSPTIKRGNVDADIIFEMMRQMCDNIDLDKIILISGDGDYMKVVDYAIKKAKFLKIIFPNGKMYSSLYDSLGNEFQSCLENPDIKFKIMYVKKKWLSLNKK